MQAKCLFFSMHHPSKILCTPWALVQLCLQYVSKIVVYFVNLINCMFLGYKMDISYTKIVAS